MRAAWYRPVYPGSQPVDRRRCRCRVWAENEKYPRQCSNRGRMRHDRRPVCGTHKRMLVRRANTKRARNLP